MAVVSFSHVIEERERVRDGRERVERGNKKEKGK